MIWHVIVSCGDTIRIGRRSVFPTHSNNNFDPPHPVYKPLGKGKDVEAARLVFHAGTGDISNSGSRACLKRPEGIMDSLLSTYAIGRLDTLLTQRPRKHILTVVDIARVMHVDGVRTVL